MESIINGGCGYTAPNAIVLLVDDDEINLLFLLEQLKPLHMHIDIATSGKMALQLIHIKNYNLIFIDHRMPEMDGIETSMRIRRLAGDYFKNVPIIALSANEDASVKNFFLQTGINGFLAKPVNKDEIYAVIKTWLPESLLHRQDKPNLITQAGTKDSFNSQDTSSPTDLLFANGIDVNEGIRRSGSKDIFYKLLGYLYKLIELKAAKIEQCLTDGLIQYAAIEAHALKNTARMIGAKTLSEGFARLEQYGGKEDKEALEREAPIVLGLFKSYKTVLRPFGEAENRIKKTTTKEEIISLLRKLQSSMTLGYFDVDIADEVIKQLESTSLPMECQPRMELLKAYTADVAAENVVETAETIIDAIRKSDLKSAESSEIGG